MESGSGSSFRASRFLARIVSAFVACLVFSSARSNAQPANDKCGNGIKILEGALVRGTLAGATRDGVSRCASTSDVDVWFSFVASTTGNLTVSIGSSGVNPATFGLSVYTACSTSASVQVLGCSTNCSAGLGAPGIVVPVSAGASYLIRVSQETSAPPTAFDLLTSVNPRPEMDTCAAAGEIIVGNDHPINLDGAAQHALPSCSLLPNTHGPDIWYRWRSPLSGRLTLRLTGAEPGIFAVSSSTNCSVGPLAFPCKPDWSLSNPEFSADLSANVDYRIRIATMYYQPADSLHQSFSASFTPCSKGLAFAMQPPSATRRHGETATMVFSTNGQATWTVQWYRNGVAVPGMTTNGFTLTVSEATVGRYVARLTSECGQVLDSDPAYVGLSGTTPSRLYVNAAATGTNDGTSWANAIRWLPDAIRLVPPGGEVWIAQGTYFVGGPLDLSDATLRVRNGVSILGGFIGTESTSAQRPPNPLANPTVITGSIGSLRAANQYCIHIFLVDGVSNVHLDGLIIRDGNKLANYQIDAFGGGAIVVNASTLTVSNCVFTENAAGMSPFGTVGPEYRAESGGAVHIVNGSSVTFDHCQFVSNNTTNGSVTYPYQPIDPTGGGGAIAADRSTVRIGNCYFSANHTGHGANGASRISTSGTPGTGGDGGAVRLTYSVAMIDRSTFENNWTGNGGEQSSIANQLPVTGSRGGNGGAVSAASSQLAVTRSTFRGNRSGKGSDARSTSLPRPGEGGGQGGAISAEFTSLVVDSAVFVGNRAGPGGMGRGNYSGGTGGNGGPGGNGAAISAVGAGCTIRNSTFNANLPGEGGPGGYNSPPPGSPVSFPGPRGDATISTPGTTTLIANSIIWNSLPSTPPVPAISPATIPVTYSIIDGGLPGNGNLAINPQFLNPAGPDAIFGTADDDLRLAASSPAIDAGSNARVASSLDLLGTPRVIDGNGDGSAIVDIGAYEFIFAGCPCRADFDGSGGTPDISDLNSFYAAWLSGDPAANVDCSSGTPDTTDIATFFSQWLAGGC